MLINGDCRTVLPSYGPFDMIIADPPYGDTSLSWDKKVNGWEKIAISLLKPTGSLWLFGSLRSLMQTGNIMNDAGFKYAQDIVWEKHNGSAFHADRFKRVHEHVVQFYRKDALWKNVYNDVQVTADATARATRRKKRPPHTGHIEAGAYVSVDGGPRLMRSVIYMASCHGYAIHPTEKPVNLLEILIKTSCPVGGLVGDFFAGSGAVGEACYRTGRDYVGSETDHDMAEKALRRLTKLREEVNFELTSCVNSENPICPENSNLREVNELMSIAVNINIDSKTDPAVLQQVLDWAVKINGKANGAAAPNGHDVQPVTAMLVSTVETPAPVIAETPVVEEAPAPQPVAPKITGAVPPGMEPGGPKRRGRPKSPETLAKEAAAAAAASVANPAMPGSVAPAAPPVQTTGARPPGVGGAASGGPTPPAMPAVPHVPEVGTGTYTIEDVRAVFAAVSGHDTLGARQLLRASNWPSDNEAKPQWFTVDNVAPNFYDRLYCELAAMLPAQG